MKILLDDPRVASVPVNETYQPLVTLGASFGPARARVRSGIAARLRRAQLALPVGVSLRVVDGHRLPAVQAPAIGTSFAVPVRVAAHVAGAAVDVTLVDPRGVELDMGTPEDISAAAREHRRRLARVLRDAGLVNCATEWWHWSYGDRYWAVITGAPAALYGAVTWRAAA